MFWLQIFSVLVLGVASEVVAEDDFEELEDLDDDDLDYYTDHDNGQATTNSENGESEENRARRYQEDMITRPLSPSEIIEAKGAMKELFFRMGAENLFTPYTTSRDDNLNMPTYDVLKSFTSNQSLPRFTKLSPDLYKQKIKYKNNIKKRKKSVRISAKNKREGEGEGTTQHTIGHTVAPSVPSKPQTIITTTLVTSPPETTTELTTLTTVVETTTATVPPTTSTETEPPSTEYEFSDAETSTITGSERVGNTFLSEDIEATDSTDTTDTDNTEVTVVETEATTLKPKELDIPRLLEIIAGLASEFETNLTRKLNESLLNMSIPTCTTPTTAPPVTSEYDANYTGATIAKCFVCGLEEHGVPAHAQCADAFAGDFLPLVPVDPTAKAKISMYRKYCKYSNIPGYSYNASRPRHIYGRWTGGCAVRWIDLSGIYTQRTCRNKVHPSTGRHYASKRMAKLEKSLWNVENGCITSPMATLVPLSRGISLYARFHACVCTGSWCNAAHRPANWSHLNMYIFLLFSIGIT